jgi:hypothetical protein
MIGKASEIKKDSIVVTNGLFGKVNRAAKDGSWADVYWFFPVEKPWSDRTETQYLNLVKEDSESEIDRKALTIFKAFIIYKEGESS